MDEYIELETVRTDGCDEVSKIKTPFAWIIVEGTADKPCYSIMWWDTAKKECNVGCSSYYLKYVFNWLKEEFEITEEAADVAPVVRCKDCAHSTFPSVLTQRYGKPGTLTCHNMHAPSNRRNVGSNDFCSYGERRDDA